MKKDTVIMTGSALAALLLVAGVYSYCTTSTTSAVSANTPAEQAPAAAEEAAKPQSVSFRVLESGAYAVNVPTRKNYVAYAEEGLMKLWAMAHGTDGKPLPKVDFSKEYVIGVFSGEKSTGGHSIAVAAVIDALDTRIVDVRLTKPGAECMVTQSLTNPYQIIVLPFSSTKLTHKDTEVQSPCE